MILRVRALAQCCFQLEPWLNVTVIDEPWLSVARFYTLSVWGRSVLVSAVPYEINVFPAVFLRTMSKLETRNETRNGTLGLNVEHKC